MSLKDIEKYAVMEFVINGKIVCFKKDRENKQYFIIAGKNTYIFDNYKSAINANIVKSRFGRWLTLKDVDKISSYYAKIKKIELKGLIEGKTIFIDYDDEENDYSYDDENDKDEFVW